MHRIPIFLLLLVVSSTQEAHPRLLQATSVTITASRSPQVGNLCSNANRASLSSQYGTSGDVKYMTDFSRFLTLDDTVFNQFLKLDVVGMNDQLRGNTLGYATYVAPAFLAPVLLLLFAPLLLVCLCCPMKCCLRRKLQYSGCERTWPALMTMLLAVTVVAACFVGLFSEFKLYNGYQQLSCSGIIGVDDALYGASTSDGKTYFAGVSTINAHLQTLTSGNLNYILNNLTAVSSAGSSTSAALNLINAALVNITAIPDPSGNTLSLSYSTPFSSPTPTAALPSTFPALLGTASDNSSLVGVAYAAVETSSANLSSITTTVDSFKTQASSFSSSVAQMINDTAHSISLLKTTLLTINDLFVSQDYFSSLYYIQTLFYGVILGVTMLYLLSLTVFACCDKMSCRHMLYLMGFLLFLITVATLAVFFLLTFTSVVFNSGCSYMANSIKDPDTFVTNVGKLGIDSNVASQYSVCLKGQSGDILGKLSGAQSRNYLKTLQYVMTNITSFNGASLNTQINSAYAPLQQSLANYASAYTTDISDTAAIQELKFIATPSNFNCSSGNFQFDSWIPSIHQTDGTIPCASPPGMPSSDNSTCTSSADFSAPTLSCEGCMGTFSLLYNATSQAAANSILNSRYAGCSSFNSQLANIWQNYYLIKKNVLGAVGSREYTARQSVQAVSQSITQNLAPTFQNTISKLYQTSQAILTPNYGVLWGLDCSVVGEDMVLFQETACYNTFSYSYFHRILALVISASLLLLLCCNTCTLFRRRKDILEHLEGPRKQRAHPYLATDPLSNGRLQSDQL